MLSHADSNRIELRPGAKGTIELDVTNLRDKIDGIAPLVYGLPDDVYSIPVAQVPVFPNETQTVQISLALPRTFEAGEHDFVVELRSTVDGEARIEHPLTLVVEADDEIALKLDPRAGTAGSKASFDAVLVNTGNTKLNMAVDAADAERLLTTSVDKILVEAPPGRESRTRIEARGRRPFFGSPVRRTITVTADHPEHQLAATYQFTQKARIPAGVGTMAILATIVALWAFVFMWAINNVFADGDAAKATGEGFATTGPSSIDVAGVNGTITGQVVNQWEEGIAGLTVSATRAGADDPVASVSTDENGFFSIPVLPGSYVVTMGGNGFPTSTVSDDVSVAVAMTTEVTASTAVGEVGSIRGTVIAGTGGGSDDVVYSVVVARINDDTTTELIRDSDYRLDAPTALDGGYTIRGLTTPATYRVTIGATSSSDDLNFASSAFEVELDGGADVIVNTVRLGAAQGSLAGRVCTTLGSDGSCVAGTELGGVTVSLVGGETMLELATPTAGTDVGRFVFDQLESPQTYLLTFAADGFRTETVALELGPGEVLQVDDLQMLEGTGELCGTITDDSDDARLGQVIVTVSGTLGSASTQSLSAAADGVTDTECDTGTGSYRIEGLVTPGVYAVTFTRDGYLDETRILRLTDAAPSDRRFDVDLSPELGSITGTVSVAGTPTAEVTVTLTDGLTVRETASVSSPAGRFTFVDLPAGIYTLIFEQAGTDGYAILIDLDAGDDVGNADADLTVTAVLS